MTPLHPMLRRLLRAHVRNEAPLPKAGPAFAAKIVQRARAEGAFRRRGAAGISASDQEPILTLALAFSVLLIVAGATVLIGNLDQSLPQANWVSASQFAASQFLP